MLSLPEGESLDGKSENLPSKHRDRTVGLVGEGRGGFVGVKRWGLVSPGPMFAVMLS